MSGLYRMFDAAYPPATAPAGCTIAAGYIGGGTPHVWTVDEWHRFAHLAQVPIWVPALDLDPAAQAKAACEAAAKLGWKPFDPSAWERAVVFDLETSADPQWWDRLETEVENCGFTAVCYGSMSTVFGNRAANNWVAAWDGDPAIEPWQVVVAHQYAADVTVPGGGQVDYSTASLWLAARAGVGPRHG